jgi:thioesterase domain-containing protein
MCKEVVVQDCEAPSFKQFLVNEFRKVDQGGRGHVTVEVCAVLIHAIMVMQDGPLVPPLPDDVEEESINKVEDESINRVEEESSVEESGKDANEEISVRADEVLQEQKARLAQKEMARDEHTRSICAMIAKYLSSQAHHHQHSSTHNHDHHPSVAGHTIPLIPEAETEGVYIHNFADSLPSILAKRAQEVQRFRNSNTAKHANTAKYAPADSSAFWVELPAVGWGVHYNPLIQAAPWDMNPNSIARSLSQEEAGDHFDMLEEPLQLATAAIVSAAAQQATAFEAVDGPGAEVPRLVPAAPTSASATEKHPYDLVLRPELLVLSELGGSPCLSYWYNILTRRSRWTLDFATAKKLAVAKGVEVEEDSVPGIDSNAADGGFGTGAPSVQLHASLVPGAPVHMKTQPTPSLKTVLAHAYHQARNFSMQKRREIHLAEQQREAQRLQEDIVGISASTQGGGTSVVLHQQSLDKIGLRWMLQKVGLGLSAYERLRVESALTWNEEGMVSKLGFLNQLPGVLNHLMFSERKSRQAKIATATEFDTAGAEIEGAKNGASHLERWRDWCIVHRLKDPSKPQDVEVASKPVTISSGGASDEEVEFSFYYNRYTGESCWSKPEQLQSAELRAHQEAKEAAADKTAGLFAAEPSISEYLGVIFESTDDDCSGEICKDEFPELIRVMGMKLTKEQERTMLKLLDVNRDGTITWAEFIQETPKIIVDILGNPTDDAMAEEVASAVDPLDEILGKSAAGANTRSSKSKRCSVSEMMNASHNASHKGGSSMASMTNWVVLHMPIADLGSATQTSKPFWFNKLTSEAQWGKPVEVQLLQQVQPDLMDYLSLKFLEADDDLSGSVSKPEFCSLIVDIGVGINGVSILSIDQSAFSR